MWTYSAEITRVVDGDTYDAIVDLGFDHFQKIRIRLHDFDTPETYRPKTAAERRHGEAAKSYVQTIFNDNHNQITITTYKHKADIYARYTAAVTLADGTDLRTLLKESGFEKRAIYGGDEI